MADERRCRVRCAMSSRANPVRGEVKRDQMRQFLRLVERYNLGLEDDE